MSYFIEMYNTHKKRWTMWDERFESMIEASEAAAQIHEDYFNCCREEKRMPNDSILRIISEKNTVAGTFTLSNNGHPLYRCAWDSIQYGDELYIYNLEDTSEMFKWGIKEDDITSLHSGIEVPYNSKYEYFTREDRYSYEWQKEYFERSTRIALDSMGFSYSEEKLAEVNEKANKKLLEEFRMKEKMKAMEEGQNQGND